MHARRMDLRHSVESSDLVRLQRPCEPLQFDVANRRGVNGLLDGRVHAWADEDLPGLGSRAESRREVRYRSERTVVVTALEADPPEGRVTRFDPDPERLCAPPLPPKTRQLLKALARSHREANGLKLVLCHGQWIVEEDHHPVAGEVLERSLVMRDQLAKRGVVLAQYLEEILRSGRLCE